MEGENRKIFEKKMQAFPLKLSTFAKSMVYKRRKMNKKPF